MRGGLRWGLEIGETAHLFHRCLSLAFSRPASTPWALRNKPVRAQVVARAQENQIYIVHANAGAGPGGSHGQSRIVDPYGTVVVEAPIWGDYLFTKLDFSELPGPMGTSYNGWPGYIGNEDGAQRVFADWWEAGMRLMEALKQCQSNWVCCISFKRNLTRLGSVP